MDFSCSCSSFSMATYEIYPRLAHYRELKELYAQGYNAVCPQCGQGFGHSTHREWAREYSWVPYIGADGRPIDAAVCGKCNHAHSCNYHLPPRLYYSKYADASGVREKVRRIVVPLPNEQQIAHYYGSMASIYAQSQENAPDYLFTFLCRLFDAEAVSAAYRALHITASRDGSTVYWQKDEQGRLHAGKVIRYSLATGKRDKGAGGVGWVGSSSAFARVSRPRGVCQCLFGLHQLNGLSDAARLFLTEGEKAALYGKILRPDAVWLATGGMQNFKENMLEPLANRRVCVLPDADALDKWCRKATLLNGRGYHLDVPSQWILRMINPPHAGTNHDLEDMWKDFNFLRL